MPFSLAGCWRIRRKKVEMNRSQNGPSEATIRPVGSQRASPHRASVHRELWGEGVPVVGMLHLLPLPGSPRWGGSMDEVITRASKEATILAEEGVDGVLVENFGDAPFYPDGVPPETVAAMAVSSYSPSAGTSMRYLNNSGRWPRRL